MIYSVDQTQTLLRGLVLHRAHTIVHAPAFVGVFLVFSQAVFH